MSVRTTLGVLTTLMTCASALWGQQAPTPATDTPVRPVPAESSSVTHHSMTIERQRIRYTARTGTLLVRNDSGIATGSMFYVAYTKDGADSSRRPVTFVFNGGPGSSSIWLHMGSFGPVRVITSDPQSTPPAPYTVAENPFSLIDRTDLVFVDAMGTGFSRLVGKGEGKDFYGVDQDIRAFGDFIVRYATAFDRWNSPKYLMGESYGTTRAAGLANALQARGMSLSGVILISSILNFYLDWVPPNSLELTYPLNLPTMAATAWYHRRLPRQPPALAAFLRDVEVFALGPYQQALTQGNALGAADRDSIVAALHAFTGLPESYIRAAHLRVTPGRFQKEVLRTDERTAARLDGRYLGIDRDAAGETPEYDAMFAAIAGPFTAAFNHYLASDLHYDAGDKTYLTTNYPVVGADWDMRHRVGGDRWPIPDVAEDLRQAMTQNPYLRVFAANGYYDFATPYFATMYTFGHMGLDPSLDKNISYGFYEGGHMMYLNQAILAQMKADLGAFYDRSQAH